MSFEGRITCQSLVRKSRMIPLMFHGNSGGQRLPGRMFSISVLLTQIQLSVKFLSA